MNKLIQLLEECPRTNAELPYRISLQSMSIEDFGRIKHIKVAGNQSKKRGRFATIYYLDEDVDREVVKFTEVNAGALAKIDFSGFNTIDSGMTKEMAQKIRGILY